MEDFWGLYAKSSSAQDSSDKLSFYVILYVISIFKWIYMHYIVGRSIGIMRYVPYNITILLLERLDVFRHLFYSRGKSIQ